MPDTRYEFKPFKYSSHYWILNALRGETEPVRILDVGTASGYLGKIWRRSGHYVAGIEYDAASAEKAREHYDVFQVADIAVLPEHQGRGLGKQILDAIDAWLRQAARPGG